MSSAPPLIAYAIPGFLLLIGIELLWARLKKRNFYRLNDSLNNLTLGIFSRISAIFVYGLVLAGYFGLYHTFFREYRLLTISWTGIEPGLIPWEWQGLSASLFVCFIGFLLVDHQYYWFHRMSHEIAVIWGSHEPHHQSEEYNLSVALRQGSFQGIFSFPFYLPLAFLGLDPWLFAVFSQLNTIYQFWIHTRAIGKLGFLEIFMNTPSHHRVHHGINPQYIDKNHAGTLIIWDKLYGTFEPEGDEVVYGTVAPLASWNPVWANFQYWWKLIRDAVRFPGLKNKVRAFFALPGWKPDELGGKPPIPEVTNATRPKFNPPLPGPLASYSFVLFLLGLVFAVVLIGLNVSKQAFSLAGALAALASLWSLLNVGLLLERRVLGVRLEYARLLASSALGLFLISKASSNLVVAWIFLGLTALMGAWFFLRASRIETKHSEVFG